MSPELSLVIGALGFLSLAFVLVIAACRAAKAFEREVDEERDETLAELERILALEPREPRVRR